MTDKERVDKYLRGIESCVTRLRGFIKLQGPLFMASREFNLIHRRAANAHQILLENAGSKQTMFGLDYDEESEAPDEH